MRNLKLHISLSVIGCLLVSISANAQHLKVASGTNMTFSGNINLVLQDISFENEATIDAENGDIIIDNAGTVSFITDSELVINSIEISGAGGSAEFEGSFDINDFTVPSNHTATFSDTSSITVNTSISNPGDLVLESGASLILKSDVSSVSDITVYKTTTFNSSTGKYSVVGSPVSGSGFSVLGTNAQSWIFDYDETVAYGADGSARFGTPSESTMTQGKGYFSAFTGDSEGTVIFYGTPRIKNLTYAVTRTSNMGDANDVKGFNLIANPFTSAIEFDRFMTTNGSILEEESIWLWDDIASDVGGGTNDDYITINDLGNTDSNGGRESDWDGTMNSAQGFFIKASTSDDITFNQAMKTHDGNDDASYYRTESIVVEKYWIGIRQGDFYGTNTLVGFHPEATEGLDPKYDASRFGDALSLFSIIGENRYAIQGLPSEWISNSESISQIGYHALEAGDYTISIDRSENASGSVLYLNDYENELSIELLSKEYTFSTEAGTYFNRFSISTSPEDFSTITSVNEVHKDVNIYGTLGSIVLSSDLSGELLIHTIDGKIEFEGSFETGETTFDVSAPGLYIISLETIEGVSTYKVIVD